MVGWWVGVPTRRIHHPITPLPPALRALLVTFLSPRHSGGCREYTEGSNRLLLTSLVAFPRLLVSPQTPTQFSHLSRYADLPWLSLGSYSTCPHPSWLSFSALMLQKLISSKRLAWLLRLVSTRAKKEQHMPLPISIMDSRVWEEGKGGRSGVGQGNSSNGSSQGSVSPLYCIRLFQQWVDTFCWIIASVQMWPARVLLRKGQWWPILYEVCQGMTLISVAVIPNIITTNVS